MQCIPAAADVPVATEKKLNSPRCQARFSTYVDAACSYRPSSVVCRSVCLSVCHTSEPCKNGCTDRALELPFGLRTWVGTGNHVFDGGPGPPWEGANFWGRMGVPL